jgi:hypothetical protein
MLAVRRHLQDRTRDLPGSADQTTAYDYSVTEADGSSINSNDLLTSVTYPDIGTDVNDTDTFTYNALGERRTFTDRNGTRGGRFYRARRIARAAANVRALA